MQRRAWCLLQYGSQFHSRNRSGLIFWRGGVWKFSTYKKWGLGMIGNQDFWIRYKKLREYIECLHEHKGLSHNFYVRYLIHPSFIRDVGISCFFQYFCRESRSTTTATVERDGSITRDLWKISRFNLSKWYEYGSLDMSCCPLTRFTDIDIGDFFRCLSACGRRSICWYCSAAREKKYRNEKKKEEFLHRED